MIRQSSACFRRVLFALVIVGLGLPAWAQFETRATTKLPQGADCIALGDFNNDGKLDLVVTDGYGLTVSLGNGDGTFEKPILYRTQLSYYLAVADFNNDGNLDIVVANLNPSTVDVYLGNGDGTFKKPISSNTTDGSYFVTVGDFNDDGKQDIAIIDGPNVSVLLGNGNGTFGAPSDNNSFYGAQWLAVGDFNNDHKLDVLTSGSLGGNYYVAVLLGNGDGTLQDAIDTPVEYITASVAGADMNGDGNLDAVLGDDLDGVAVLLGDGNGSFEPPVYYSTTGLGNGEVLVSDLNRNGKLDVAVPSASHGLGGVDVFWGNGDGTLQAAQFFSSGLDTGLPAVGDLNGDGLSDIALANGEVGTITMLNTGVISFSPTTPLNFVGAGEQALKLTNNGTKPVSISSIKASGAFEVRDTCGSSVRSGASCQISVLSSQRARALTQDS